MHEQFQEIIHKGLLCSSAKTVFRRAKFHICEDTMLHDLKEGEWCLRRCAELGDERAIRILQEYELTGDLVAAFKAIVG